MSVGVNSLYMFLVHITFNYIPLNISFIYKTYDDDDDD